MPVAYTLRQVADQLSLSLPTVERMVRDGTLRSFRARGAIRVTEQAVEDYIRERETDQDRRTREAGLQARLVDGQLELDPDAEA